MIAFYVFVWATITGSFSILFLHLLLKRTSFMVRTGIGFFVMLCVFCILRILLPMEFEHFQYRIEYPSFLSYFFRERHLFHTDFTIIQLTVLVALAISLIRLFQLYRTATGICKTMKSEAIPFEEGNTLLHSLIPECKIPVYYTRLSSTPVIVGYLHPVIYLPYRRYSAEQLTHILYHEYTHWKYHHIHIRLFIQIIVCFFWWNPFIYMFQKDVSHVIEMVCDSLVTQLYPSESKLSYLNTIIHCLRKPEKPSPSHHWKNPNHPAIGFAADPRSFATQQRFSYMLRRDKYLNDSGHAKDKAANFTSISKLISPLRNWGFVCLMYAFTLFCMVSTYYFMMQPAFEPENVMQYSNSTNSYLVDLGNGSYEFHYKGYCHRVPQKEVDAGYFCIYTMIPYEEYANLGSYKDSPSYRHFLKKSTSAHADEEEGFQYISSIDP